MQRMDIDPRGEAVREMFDGISGRYDRMNRLMTFGRDRSWRRHVIRMASVPRGGRLLDVATGTGDIAAEARGRDASIRVTGIDFSIHMMQAGRRRRGGGLGWCCADALALPFADACFDAVTSGFLVRNVSDPRRAFAEQRRVVRPGGRVVCLDTSPPPESWVRPWTRFYLTTVIPLLGSIFGDGRHAYRYLTESTRAFKPPEELAKDMEAAGLCDVSYRRCMLGTIVIMAGSRPSPADSK